MNSIIAALYGDPSKGTPVSPHSRPAYTPDYTSAYKPAPTSTKTVAQLEQEERDRKRAAVEAANTPNPSEEKSRDIITSLYLSWRQV